jgi:hypothetical protein
MKVLSFTPSRIGIISPRLTNELVRFGVNAGAADCAAHGPSRAGRAPGVRTSWRAMSCGFPERDKKRGRVARPLTHPPAISLQGRTLRWMIPGCQGGPFMNLNRIRPRAVPGISRADAVVCTSRTGGSYAAGRRWLARPLLPQTRVQPCYALPPPPRRVNRWTRPRRAWRPGQRRPGRVHFVLDVPEHFRACAGAAAPLNAATKSS